MHAKTFKDIRNPKPALNRCTTSGGFKVYGDKYKAYALVAEEELIFSLLAVYPM